MKLPSYPFLAAWMIAVTLAIALLGAALLSLSAAFVLHVAAHHG